MEKNRKWRDKRLKKKSEDYEGGRVSGKRKEKNNEIKKMRDGKGEKREVSGEKEDVIYKTRERKKGEAM